MSYHGQFDARDRTLPKGRIDFGSWFLTVISWDGLLPPTVLLVPYLLSFLFPNTPGVIEVAAKLLPVAALVVRLHVGSRRILFNHCGTSARRAQMGFLCFGLSMLLGVDAFLILSHVAPRGMPCWHAQLW